MYLSFVENWKEASRMWMLIILAVICSVVNFFIGLLVSKNSKKVIEKCETLEEIMRREG